MAGHQGVYARLRGLCPAMTKESKPPHSTTIFASSVTEDPLSPSQVNAGVPLVVAVVKKVTNGLAASAGKNSVAKISSPLYRHENDVMMSRGIICPLVLWRKPVSMMCEISVLISITSPRFALAGTLMRARALMGRGPQGRPQA